VEIVFSGGRLTMRFTGEAQSCIVISELLQSQ